VVLSVWFWSAACVTAVAWPCTPDVHATPPPPAAAHRYQPFIALGVCWRPTRAETVRTGATPADVGTSPALVTWGSALPRRPRPVGRHRFTTSAWGTGALTTSYCRRLHDRAGRHRLVPGPTRWRWVGGRFRAALDAATASAEPSPTSARHGQRLVDPLRRHDGGPIRAVSAWPARTLRAGLAAPPGQPAYVPAHRVRPRVCDPSPRAAFNLDPARRGRTGPVPNIDTDAPGESGELAVDLVPGPGDLLAARSTTQSRPPCPTTAVVDQFLPPGTIRVADRGRRRTDTNQPENLGAVAPGLTRRSSRGLTGR